MHFVTVKGEPIVFYEACNVAMEMVKERAAMGGRAVSILNAHAVCKALSIISNEIMIWSCLSV